MGLIAMNEQRMPVLSVSDGQSAIASSLERAWGVAALRPNHPSA